LIIYVLFQFSCVLGLFLFVPSGCFSDVFS